MVEWYCPIPLPVDVRLRRGGRSQGDGVGGDAGGDEEGTLGAVEGIPLWVGIQ